MLRRAGFVAILMSVAFAQAAYADPSAKSGSAAVPNVSSQRLDLALAKLKKAGFGTTRVSYTAKSPQHPIFKKRWRVCAQKPKSGTHVSGDVLLSVHKVCARAFKRATQREVPYMRQFNNAEDWRTLAAGVCDNYATFSYASLSKVVAASIDKQPYEGEIDAIIRIAHKTNCPEVRSTRF